MYNQKYVNEKTLDPTRINERYDTLLRMYDERVTEFLHEGRRMTQYEFNSLNEAIERILRHRKNVGYP